METPQGLTYEALRNEAGRGRALEMRVKQDGRYSISVKALFASVMRGENSRNFASANGRKTYNASSDGELLSRWKAVASRSCFSPLEPFSRGLRPEPPVQRRSQQQRPCGTSGTRH